MLDTESKSAADSNYVAVVGAVNVDINGISHTRMILGDSNPGQVTVTPGGVGRNIAENLVRLGFNVKLIAALGDDRHAHDIRLSCDKLDLDISQSLTVAGKRTSTYLCVSDFNGEIVAAVNDMAIYEELTPDFLEGKIDVLNNANLVVIDANLPRESIDYIARNCKKPIVADPVSVKKAGRLSSVIDALAFMKPNRPEAALLTGVTIHSTTDLTTAAKRFFDMGLKRVLISLGDEGVYFNDKIEYGILPCYSSVIRNTTGCGDAFLAGATAGFLSGGDLREMTRMGLAAASVCANSVSAVNADMNMNVIRRVIGAF